MLYIKELEEGLELFKALGSEVRIKILQQLLTNQERNLNELAASLNLTNGALTGHIKKLEDAGLIAVTTEFSGHGNQKVCRVSQDRILVDIVPRKPEGLTGIYENEIPIGQYMHYSVFPTCGIATKDALIGEVDDPRYFAHPDRIHAGILWLTRGFVEYSVPNFLPAGQKIEELAFSMELASEAPGVNHDWPSDITFSLNDVEIGQWMSPGDFGDVRGNFTPEWFPGYWNQYGFLKMLTINQWGTYIDGRKISGVSLKQFALDYKSSIRLKLEVKEDAAHVGGLTLFGAGFGNYSQGIKVRIRYSPMEGK